MAMAGRAETSGVRMLSSSQKAGIRIVHEAGLANAIAGEIRERGLEPGSMRLEVTGGHDDVDAFDAALRLHLSLALPGLDVAAIAIDHRATRLCGDCGVVTGSGGGDGPCPTCGRPAVVLPTPEQVAIRVGHGVAGAV